MSLYIKPEVEMTEQPERLIREKWEQLRENQMTENSCGRRKLAGRWKIKNEYREAELGLKWQQNRGEAWLHSNNKVYKTQAQMIWACKANGLETTGWEEHLQTVEKMKSFDDFQHSHQKAKQHSSL